MGNECDKHRRRDGNYKIFPKIEDKRPLENTQILTIIELVLNRPGVAT